MFTFAPAIRENVTLLIALAGASGSGKTMSALELAKGLSPSGKTMFIDTEARRALHYGGSYQFMHADMRPPFRPQRFVEAVRAAEEAGAEVVIIDSASHEYDGEGGITEWAAQLEESGTKAPGNWKIPKHAHKRMMNAMLQCRAHIIFCLRADEKIKIEMVEIDGRKKSAIVPLGWMPICERRMMYEMVASFTLAPDTPGMPRFDLPHKLQEQHRHIFQSGRHINEQAGRDLAAWARGGAVPPARAPVTLPDDLLTDLLETGRGRAEGGTAALRAWLEELTDDESAAVRAANAGLGALAKAADQARAA